MERAMIVRLRKKKPGGAGNGLILKRSLAAEAPENLGG
jgi:hypothetical protein